MRAKVTIRPVEPTDVDGVFAIGRSVESMEFTLGLPFRSRRSVTARMEKMAPNDHGLLVMLTLACGRSPPLTNIKQIVTSGFKRAFPRRA
jgi:hypothetical protein